MFEKLKALSTRQKVLAGIVTIAIFYTIFGFLVLPSIIKPMIVDKLSFALKREVAIKKISINPYALSFRITGFEVNGNGGNRFASFDEL